MLGAGVCLPLPVLSAEVASISWHGAVIEYDTTHFRVSPPPPTAGFVLTCIASDCPGEPSILAMAMARNSDAAGGTTCLAVMERNGSDRSPLDFGNGAATSAMGFSAYTGWSGCRAMDAPVLEACAEQDGVVYRLTNQLASGCNFNAKFPIHRFTELLNGVRPARCCLGATVAALMAGPSLGLAVETAAVSVADVTIRYDPARWEVRDGPNAKSQLWADPEPVSLYFDCIAPDCHDRPSVWVSAVPSGSSPSRRCAPPGIEEDWRHNVRSILGIPTSGRDFGGLALHGVKTFSGCRARTPSARRACGSTDGTDYAFGSGAHFGCGGIEGVPDEMFIELLSGISLNAANPGKARPQTISPPPNP